MFSLIRAFVFLTFVLVLVACGREPAAQPAAAPSFETLLKGKWASGCMKLGEFTRPEGEKYGEVAFEVKRTNAEWMGVEVTVQGAADPFCRAPFSASMLLGRFKLGETTSESTTLSIDFGSVRHEFFDARQLRRFLDVMTDGGALPRAHYREWDAARGAPKLPEILTLFTMEEIFVSTPPTLGLGKLPSRTEDALLTGRADRTVGQFRFRIENGTLHVPLALIEQTYYHRMRRLVSAGEFALQRR